MTVEESVVEGQAVWDDVKKGDCLNISYYTQARSRYCAVKVRTGLIRPALC